MKLKQKILENQKQNNIRTTSVEGKTYVFYNGKALS